MRKSLFSYALFAFVVGLFLIFGQAVKAQSALDGFDPNANGTVRSIVVQPDGKILIGGDFTTVAPNGGAAVARNRIARLNTDGTLDTAFNPNANSSILSIVLQPDGRILIGGFFTTLAPNGGGIVMRNRVARLNADGTLDTGFDPNCNGGVFSIAVKPDGRILVGGQFTGFSPNGGAFVARNFVAQLNADGTVEETFNPNPNSSVFSFSIQPDGRILMVGDFSRLAPNGGATVFRNFLARFNADGTLDAGFNPSADSTVRSIVLQPDGKMVIGGDFTTLAPNGGATVARRRIARLNPDGTLDTAFDPNADHNIFLVVLQPDGRILIGGIFSTLTPNGGATVVRNHVARLNTDGTLDSGFDPNVNNLHPSITVRSIAVQPDGKILIGGLFDTLAPNGGATVARNCIARLERDGFLDRTLDLNAVGNSVIATAVQPDGKIILGGNFTQILGQPRNHIARLNTDGTLDADFNPNANGLVRAILVQPDGKILVAGGFVGANSIGGAARNYIARLDPNTGLADSFDPNPNSVIYAVAIQPDGKIIVGGGFSGANSIGGATRNFIARLDPNTGLADSFNPNSSAFVYTIALQTDGRILVGGLFNGANSIGGQTRNYIARLDQNTGLADSFNPNASFLVRTIAVQMDGKVLAGGDFSTIGGQTRNRIARLDATSGMADSFNPNSSGSVSIIVAQSDGKIFVGGSFNGANSIGGQTRNRIARLDGTNGTADSFDPNANGDVQTINLQPDGKILVGGAFNGVNSIGGQTRNYFARLSNDTPALSALSVTRTTVSLTRDGSAAQFTRVVFEQSIDNGANWTTLGTAANNFAQSTTENPKNTRVAVALLAPQAANYTLTGLNLPSGQNILVRARGYFRSSFQNSSETTEDKVQNAFLLAPTAAQVSLSGRVLTFDGSGLRNARVVLTDANGNTRTAVTGSFGYFRFDSVQAGETYVVSVVSKRYQFSPRVITVNEELSELNFTAQP